MSIEAKQVPLYKQPEALRLAAVAIFDRNIGWQSDATVELRRQHAEIVALKAQRDELLDALKHIEPILARMCGSRAVPPMQIVCAAIANATGGAA